MCLDMCKDHIATCRGLGKRCCADCAEHSVDPSSMVKPGAGTSINKGVDRIFGAIDFGIPAR